MLIRSKMTQVERSVARPVLTVITTWLSDSILAEALGLPIVVRSRGWFVCVVQDQNQSTAYLRAGGGQMHRWPTRYNDRRAANPANLYTIRCFQTRLAGNRVPRFGT
jgi:hypothetical protein